MIEISTQIVNAAVQGNKQAFEKIITSLEGPIYNLAYRMMLNEADAKEATQEALIRIITRISTFKAEAKFTTWAYKVAMHEILDYKDMLYRQSLVSTEQFIEALSYGMDHSHMETQEEAVQLTQLKMGCATAMLHSLDGKHRAAYILVEIMDFSSKEAASILEISEDNLRKQVSRARAKLWETLDHCGIYNPKAACLCPKRLDHAQKLDRIPALPITKTIHIDQIKNLLQKIEQLGKAAAFYHAEPALQIDLKHILLNLIPE